MTAGKVAASKPGISGAIYNAAAGTALPTSATDQLDQAFAELGYVSDAGITNSNSPEIDEVKAWGGDVVLDLQTGKRDTWKFKLIEALNVDVLKAVYGADNIVGSTVADGITVKANAAAPVESCWVIDMILNGTPKRIVLPSAALTDLGEITYADGDPVGYDVTLTAHPDASGNTHYEYIGGTA